MNCFSENYAIGPCCKIRISNGVFSVRLVSLLVPDRSAWFVPIADRSRVHSVAKRWVAAVWEITFCDSNSFVSIESTVGTTTRRHFVRPICRVEGSQRSRQTSRRSSTTFTNARDRLPKMQIPILVGSVSPNNFSWNSKIEVITNLIWKINFDFPAAVACTSHARNANSNFATAATNHSKWAPNVVCPTIVPNWACIPIIREIASFIWETRNHTNYKNYSRLPCSRPSIPRPISNCYFPFADEQNRIQSGAFRASSGWRLRWGQCSSTSEKTLPDANTKGDAAGARWHGLQWRRQR